MKKYFKVSHGFAEDQYISITEDELPKAFAAWTTHGKAIFNEGAIRGQDIRLITPDWHKARGWNTGYKMTPEDYKEVSHLKRVYDEVYEQAKLIAECAIKENKPHLLSKPISEAISLISPQETNLLEDNSHNGP